MGTIFVGRQIAGPYLVTWYDTSLLDYSDVLIGCRYVLFIIFDLSFNFIYRLLCLNEGVMK